MTRLIRFHGLLLVVVSLSTLAGCGAGSTAAEQAAELQTVASWAATAQMAAEAWIDGSVPTAYARQTLQTARAQLQEEQDTLAHSSSDAAGPALLEQIGRLEQTLDQMSAAVDRDDRGDLAQQIAQLVAEAQTISARAKVQGEQP